MWIVTTWGVAVSSSFVLLMSHCTSTHTGTLHPPPCGPEHLWLLFVSSRAGVVFVSLLFSCSSFPETLMPGTCGCGLFEVGARPDRVPVYLEETQRGVHGEQGGPGAGLGS